MNGPDFSKHELIPVIAQDDATGDVLMLAYMNQAAYDETLRTGRVCYCSRSRSKLWRKGEESGNVQELCSDLLRLRRRHAAGQGAPDRRGGLPRRLPQLLLPPHRPGHAGRHRRGPARLRSRSKSTRRGIDTMADQTLETGHSRRQPAGGDRGAVPPRRLQDLLLLRSYYPTIDDDEIECLLIRAQEMARYVEQGILDAGITGYDWVLETDADVVEVCELMFSKASRRPVRWVLCVPNDSPVQTRPGPGGQAHRHGSGGADDAAISNGTASLRRSNSPGEPRKSNRRSWPTRSSKSPKPAARCGPTTCGSSTRCCRAPPG